MPVNRFRELSKVVSSSDFIYADKYLDHASSCASCTYSKRDFLFRSGNWRGVELNPLICQGFVKGDKRLLIGHSDLATTTLTALPFLAMGFNQIWGINTRPWAGRLKSLPLGLTNPTNESEFHTILGNTSHFQSADESSEFSEVFNGSIYANFSIRTNIKLRAPLANYLVTIGGEFSEPDFTNLGRVQYLRDLRSHSLTICPEGNGIDTHRLWETLYMGGTPVILSSKTMSGLIEDLPVITLNDWSELQNMAFIEDKWNALQETKFCFEKLFSSYWINSFCENNTRSIDYI